MADAAAEAVGAALPEAAAVPVEAPKTVGDMLELKGAVADSEALPPPPPLGLLLALSTVLAEALSLSRAVPEAEGELLWERDAPSLREAPHVRDTVALALAQGVMEGDGGGVPEREGEGVPEGEGGEEALTPPAGLRLSRGVALAQPPLTLAERDGEAVADSLRTDGEGVSEAPGEAVGAPLGEARLVGEARAVTLPLPDSAAVRDSDGEATVVADAPAEADREPVAEGEPVPPPVREGVTVDAGVPLTVPVVVSE